MYYTCDFATRELPSRLTIDGTVYALQITFEPCRYILNYSGNSRFEDRLDIAIQACGNTKEKAISNMVEELRSHGITLKTTSSSRLRTKTLYEALLNNLRSQEKRDVVLNRHREQKKKILSKNAEIDQFPDEPTPDSIVKIANDPIIWDLFEAGPHPIVVPKGAWTVRDILGTLQRRCRV